MSDGEAAMKDMTDDATYERLEKDVTAVTVSYTHLTLPTKRIV